MSEVEGQMAERPNLLVLMSGQHNPHVLGCYGDNVVRTPNPDSLAENGVLFEHHYCQTPLCVPSRMCFMTGRQPSDIRVWANSCVLPMAVGTFAHALGAAGRAGWTPALTRFGRRQILL